LTVNRKFVGNQNRDNIKKPNSIYLAGNYFKYFFNLEHQASKIKPQIQYKNNGSHAKICTSEHLRRSNNDRRQW
jgi:hypothetical protein